MLGNDLHESVLKSEVIKALSIKPDGVYIDATFGRGGHSESILNSLGPHGRLVAIDRDPEAVEAALKLQKCDKRFSVAHTNFGRMGMIPETSKLLNSIDGILFDLGVPSPQLQDPSRGFSFMRDGPLDMRMNPESGQPSAEEWLAKASRPELIEAIKDYGEEKNWRRIVDAVIEARAITPLHSTKALSELVLSCIPAKQRYASKIHPATKAFQGIRIAVNKEIEAIEKGLPTAFERLKPNGRLCVISFHSLEDRIAKNLFRQWAGRPAPGDNRPQDMRQRRANLLTRRPTQASDREIASNSRSRSAKLRALRKAE